MPTQQTKSGFAAINGAQIFYETAGQGIPFIMIHAGVADNRQWNNEFISFSQSYQVIRYDLRGFGKSEPVIGEFNHMNDLGALLDFLKIHEAFILMGCSMGGSLAMDFSLANPSRVKALIMVDSGPSGLKLDLPENPKFKDAEKAFEDGDLDLTAEIETQIWFDGLGRTPEQVDQAMRKLLYEMNHIALSHKVKQLGERLPNTMTPAADHLIDLAVPVLIIVGAHDSPYVLAAADIMVEKIPSARKEIISDAAHMPNMDQPREFQLLVKTFLDDFPG